MRMLHEVNNVFTGDGTTQRLRGITIRIPGPSFHNSQDSSHMFKLYMRIFYYRDRIMLPGDSRKW